MVMRHNILFGMTCALATALAWAGGERPDSSYADLILRHGKVVTVDRDFHIFSAVCPEGGSHHGRGQR